MKSYAYFEKILAKRGLTSYMVSKTTGIPFTTFYKWKHGQAVPKWDKMCRIANCLSVPGDVLDAEDFYSCGRSVWRPFSSDFLPDAGADILVSANGRVWIDRLVKDKAGELGLESKIRMDDAVWGALPEPWEQDADDE